MKRTVLIASCLSLMLVTMQMQGPITAKALEVEKMRCQAFAEHNMKTTIQKMQQGDKHCSSSKKKDKKKCEKAEKLRPLLQKKLDIEMKLQTKCY